MWSKRIILSLFFLGTTFVALGRDYYEESLQREKLLLQDSSLSENFKKLIHDFKKTYIVLCDSFSQKQVNEMIALASMYQKLSHDEKLKVLIWAKYCYVGVATPECKTLLLLNLAYDKEIDYQEEMERAWQFAKDNKSRYMPIVFPFSIKKKGDRSLFISHRPLDRANWTYLFRYEWYMTEEYTGDKNYRDLTKVDYFLEEDSTEVKDLWEKLRNNKPNPFSPVTKKQFQEVLDCAGCYQKLSTKDQNDFLTLLRKKAMHGNLDLSLKLKVTMFIHMAYDKDISYDKVKNTISKRYKPHPSFAFDMTKKNGKTIFTVHQPEKKYLKDYSLCFCVPLEDGYLDNIGFRKLDAVEYVNAAEK